jgi:hypothetical protein
MSLCIVFVVFLWKQIEIGENQNPKMMDQGKVQFFEEINSLANQLPNFTNRQMNTLTTHAASDEFVFALHPAQVLVRSTSTRIATAMCAVLLTACGGGGGGDTASDSVSLAKTVTAFTPKPVTTAPVNPATPADGTSGSTPIVAGALLTDFSIQNIGTAAQADVPFTFGQVIAQGQMNVKEGLAAKLPDGTLIRLQSDIKATHPDGSVRHVVISGVLPALALNQTQTLQLVKSSASQKTTESLQTLAKSGLSSKVTITLDGVKYTASLADALAADTSPRNWLSGNVANEWHLNAPLKNAAGVVQPRLAARFDVRWYSGLKKQARVDVVVENNKAFVTGSNLTYDVDVEVAGRSVYSKAALLHYHHARWHQKGWWDTANIPLIDVKLNSKYLMATKAVPNFDSRIVPAEKELANWGKGISDANNGPMKIGPIVDYMPMAGGRGDIGPLPGFSAMYLLSMDKRARDAMMSAADGSGSWSIHYRDENTGYPIRTDNAANSRVTTHYNLSTVGPLPIPRFVNAATPYEADTAHQPSLAYLPYLVTGDYYYLEELQFWAAWNPLGTDPGNSGNGQGLVRWQQLRGQAWSLRTLGHSAYITPDADPLKGYFTKQLDNNLDFYHQAYVVGNPNKLGMYDGSGENAASLTTSPPWQDDFLTWSFGYLSELGFTKATPILKWKATYPVGRMTAPGYCWIQGAAYQLKFRDTPTSPIYDSFEKLYMSNYDGPNHYDDNGTLFIHPQGLRYIDQPCGSQAQVDFLSLVHHFKFEARRMTGYADSTLGYPANMQPALAVSATSGIPNAAEAWTLFESRSAKPPYQNSPQWAIVPR